MSAPRAERNQAIDWLRGAVMIVMALDHSRMFVGSPVDLHTASVGLYFTRWVTNFCAPVFVLLAGMSAYLHGQQLDSTRALSGYLFTRGFWLALLEITVIRAVWMFSIGPGIFVLQVIWAIGASMMVLAALVWLPRAAIATFAVALIAGHNLLDAIHPGDVGALSSIWLLLHENGRLEPFPGARWIVVYPLVPWVAVMAAGYVIGPWARLPREMRRRRFLRTGVALTGGFVLLRAINLYGDPDAWTTDGGPLRALLSFLDCEKYPPSLLFLMMTLGPMLCLLAWMDRPLGAWATRVAIFGRVPLFYYVLHLFVIHAAAIALAWLFLDARALAGAVAGNAPLNYSLPVVYAVWVVAVLTLYPACRWFAAVKQRSRHAWMSYL